MLEYLKAWTITHLPLNEKGQDAVEYALLVAFIALVIVGAVAYLGTQIRAVFQSIAGQVGV